MMVMVYGDDDGIEMMIELKKKVTMTLKTKIVMRFLTKMPVSVDKHFFNSTRSIGISYLIQVCSIHMVLEQFDQETVELVPDSIVMQSPKELTQYFIQSWSLTYKDMSKLL